MADIEHDQYDQLASLYDEIDKFPQSYLYQEMVETALGDCTGKTVLDLGGGTGLHARKAADRGATVVDVLDVSPGMLKAGESIETQLGHKDRLRWIVGDMSVPLKDLPEKAYDIVMVNWTFDHAETDEVLETMWANTAAYTKSGGKLISIRMSSCISKGTDGGKYGVWFTEQKEIPGGWRYVYNTRTTPVLSCPATSMNASMDFEQAKKMAERHGFVDVKKIPAEKMEMFKKDPPYWDAYMADPFFITIEATKA